MERTTPANTMNHYRRNFSDYTAIKSHLSATRQTFLDATRSEQIRMLQKSHSFAVISVQTPVKTHEEAFVTLWENDTPEENLDEALQSVNYRHNKAKYIRHSLDNTDKWSHVADLLESRDIDEAHKYIMTEFKGVGPAKAPFVLAMLGFEEKMCIDANIIRAFGMDKHVTTKVVEKYDSICDSLRDKMPTLKSHTTPFMFQWVVFSYQRNGVSGKADRHEVFFKTLGIM